MSVDLGDLRLRARRRADMETSQFVTDAELDGYINFSASDLYDLLVLKFEDYFIKEKTYNVTNTEYAHPLPDDFYKVLGVDMEFSGYRLRLHPYSVQERNEYENRLGAAGLYGWAKYSIQGSNITFIPRGSVAGTVTLLYVPKYRPMVDATDQLSPVIVEGWSEYIVLSSAIDMLNKEEADTRILESKLAVMRRRIEEASGQRDGGEGRAIVDVNSGSDFYQFYGC